MKRMNFLSALILGALGISLCLRDASAKNPTMKVQGISLGNQRDTSISIRKGKPIQSNRPEFTFIKGIQEIEGDPSASPKEALQSWKTACAEWKSETKDLNKNNEVLTLDCGRAVVSRTDFSQKLYRSSAQYQIKVRVRSAPTVNTPTQTAEAVINDDGDDDEEDDGEGDGG